MRPQDRNEINYLVERRQEVERGARHHVGPDTEILFVIPHPLQPRILSHLHDTENPGKSQVRQFSSLFNV